MFPVVLKLEVCSGSDQGANESAIFGSSGLKYRLSSMHMGWEHAPFDSGVIVYECNARSLEEMGARDLLM